MTGYTPERFLNLCKKNDIELHNIRFSGNGYEMDLLACDVFALKKLLRKTGTKIKIINKRGIPFFLFRYRNHKFFAVGVGFAFLCLITLSQFLWEIEVLGNHEITDEQILTYLREQDIYNGIRLSQIDCEGIEEQIRNDYPEIAWISVRLEGTRMILDIQELKKESGDTDDSSIDQNTAVNDNLSTTLPNQTMKQGTDLIAGRDGVVVSIVTRKGTPLVQAGAEVVKGDILVSGCNELYDDYGTVIAYEYCDADADVLIQSEEAYQDTIDIQYKKAEKTGKKRVFWTVFMPKKQFSVGMAKNSFEDFQITTYDRQISIGKYFVLPIVIQNHMIEEHVISNASRTEEEIEKIAKDHFTLYSKKLDKKGFQILDKDGKINVNEEQVFVTGLIQFQYMETERQTTEIRNLELEEGLEQDGIDSGTNGNSS